MNFTKENEDRLKVLFVELGFTGEVLAGKYGANSYTVWELLHGTTTNTLKSLEVGLKKEVIALEEQDRWTTSVYQQAKANKLKKWFEFVELTRGYKLALEEQEAKANKLAKAEKELKAMKEEVKTPAERIADKEREIEELKK